MHFLRPKLGQNLGIVLELGSAHDGALLTLKIHGREGSYQGCNTRSFSVVLNGASAPKRISVNGNEIPYSRSIKADNPRWHYDGEKMNVIIDLGTYDSKEDIVLECETSFDFVNGERGLVSRLRSFTAEAKLVYMDQAHRDVPEVMSYCNGCASVITENPFKAAEIVKGIDVEALKKELQSNDVPEKFIFKLANQIGFDVK